MKAPGTPYIELTAMHDALSADLICKTRIHKSHPDVLMLDMDAVYLAIATSNTAQDNDSKLFHTLLNLIQNEIHGL